MCDSVAKKVRGEIEQSQKFMPEETSPVTGGRRRQPPPLVFPVSNNDDVLAVLPEKDPALADVEINVDPAINADVNADVAVVPEADVSAEKEVPKEHVGPSGEGRGATAKVKRVTKPVPSILDYMTESEIKRLTKANTKKNLGEQPRKSFRFSRVCKRLDNLQFDESTYLLMPPMDPTPIVNPHSRTAHDSHKSQFQPLPRSHSQHSSLSKQTGGGEGHGKQSAESVHARSSRNKFPNTPRTMNKSLTDLSSPLSPESHDTDTIAPCSSKMFDRYFSPTTPRSLPQLDLPSTKGCLTEEGFCGRNDNMWLEPVSDDNISGYVYRPYRPAFSKQHTRSVRISSRVKVVDYFRQKSAPMELTRSRSHRLQSNSGNITVSPVSSSVSSSQSSGNETQQSTNSQLKRLLLRKSTSGLLSNASCNSSSASPPSSIVPPSPLTANSSQESSSSKSSKSPWSSTLSVFSPSSLKISVFRSRKKDSSASSSPPSAAAGSAGKSLL